MVWMNDVAERFFSAASNVELKNRHLRAAHAGEQARLRRAIIAATIRIEGGQEGTRLVLRQPLRTVPLEVRVAPLAPASRLVHELDRPPLALVLIRDPRRRADLLAQRATALFHLTPAEERLVTGLLRGHTVAELAAASGLAMPTLRTQLSSILRKVGARRQPDLIRILLSLQPQVT
jgi:DNA-binding CsgD family transcriptional regulator